MVSETGTSFSSSHVAYSTIESTWNEKGDRFKWKFVPEDPTQSTMFVWKENIKYTIPKEKIQWLGIEGLSPKRLSKLVRKSLDRFEIKINWTSSDLFNVQISLKPLPQIPNISLDQEKSQKVIGRPTLISMRNGSDLISLIRQEGEVEPFVDLILEELVNLFMKDPQRHRWAELMEVFDYLKVADQRRLIIYLFDCQFDKQKLCYSHLNDMLNEAVARLYQLSYHSIPRIKGRENLDLLFTLDQLHDLVRHLVEKLAGLQGTEVTYCLSYLVNLLEIALNAEMRLEVNRDKFVRNTEKYEVADLQVRFLVRYVIQNLKLMQDDSLRPVMSSLIRDYKKQKEIREINLIQPWRHIESLQNPQVILNISQRTEDSIFLHLMLLRQAYLRGHEKSLSDFENFVDDIQENQNKNGESIRKKLIAHNDPYFVYGLIELLRSMIAIYAVENQKIGMKSLKLLEIIYQNNLNHLEIYNHLFKIKNLNDNRIIESYLLSLFKGYAVHSSQALAEEACLFLKKTLDMEVEGSLNSRSRAASISNVASEIIEDAVSHVAPWVKGIRVLQTGLENDHQLNEENLYAIPLYGKLSFSLNEVSPPTVVEEILQQQLAKKKAKVILLLGETGAGKTLFLKRYTSEYLNHFRSSQPIPLYVSLVKLQDPQKNLIEETLKNYSLLDCVEELKKRRTVWFLDGYDEIFIDRPRERTNFFQSNRLADWPHAQFVVSCRSDFLRVGEDVILFSSSFEQEFCSIITLCPFNDTQTEHFLQRFISRKKEKGGPLIWETVDEYKQAINQLNLNNMIHNPFNLRVLAESLPNVVKQTQQGGVDPVKVTQFLLFDQWMFHRIYDEFHRQFLHHSTLDYSSPTEYLSFALKVSRKMEICGEHVILPNSKDSLKLGANRFIAQQEEKMRKAERASRDASKTETEKTRLKATIAECLKNIEEAKGAPDELHHLLFDDQFSSLRRACLLTKDEQDRVSFGHPLMYEYLRGLDTVEEDKERLKKLLKEIPSPGVLEKNKELANIS